MQSVTPAPGKKKKEEENHLINFYFLNYNNGHHFLIYQEKLKMHVCTRMDQLKNRSGCA